MKRIFLLFLVVFKITSSHVTDRVKNEQNYKETTQLPVDNETGNTPSKSDRKPSTGKPVQEDSSVYLDDVLFTLKHQNWSVEEKPCLDQIYRLLYSLQNFTLWAVWDWDAQSSEPQGLLFGNRYQLGNFDQCMNAPWSSTHPELKTKYCLADIVLERTDKAVRRKVEGTKPYESALDFIKHRPPHSRPLNELTWGACVPSACAPKTVERLLGVMLARSHLGAAGIRAKITINDTCQTNDDRREFDGLFYAFFGLIGSLAAISVVCTYFSCRKRQIDPDSISTGIVKAFCLKENASDLLRVRKEGVEVFYGIRFITICLIVLDHQIAMYNSGPISDGLSSDQEIKSAIGTLLVHDDLFVDTFFLLSGFLTMSALVKFERLPNILLIILRRYIRLVVAFAIVVFYVAAVHPYTGSGPLWTRSVAQETVQCRKNWWLNLLMLSNYIDTENICIVISWYIPCDFHFSVVTVLVFFLYKSRRGLGLAVAAVLTAAAVIVPGVIIYLNELSAVQLFTFEFITNPRASPEFQATYIKSHTRYAAYLVGVYSAYIFVTYYDRGCRMKQKWSILGVVAAVVIMFGVMIFGSTFLWRSYHPFEGAVYAALNRPVWAAAVAIIVLCCSFGHVPLLKKFFSWYPWVPLSRLSYGLYLSHAIMIVRNVFIARNPQHNDYFETLNSTVGIIFWGCVVALLLWLLAEAPANKLLMLCLRPKIRKINEEKSISTSKSTNMGPDTLPASGHLRDNLPNELSFTSKI